MADGSSGYDQAADVFVAQRSATIGVTAVSEWTRTLPPNACVLDVGCGSGVPLSEALMREGCVVYAIDPSPRLVAAFHTRFPHVPVACEPIETSACFDRQFDGVMAWGVVFLLPPDVQVAVIRRLAHAVVPGGSLLFTAPAEAATWEDALTGRASCSLGAVRYRAELAAAGLTVVRELDDEGGNHYYVSQKA